MSNKPETKAYVTVKEYNFATKELKGVVQASQFKWDFIWSFGQDQLFVKPPLGRALIENALLRFLLKKDYELESGNNYIFTISAKF
tara:strand:- start:2031 stop:2288 length:258 start_codon:yes stop_codon:yes gene_type:complete